MKRVPGAVVIPEVYLYNLLLIVSYKFNACQQKSRKIKASATTFRQHNGYSPLLNSLSLANHDMRKTWCYVCSVYGVMFRKT